MGRGMAGGGADYARSGVAGDGGGSAVGDPPIGEGHQEPVVACAARGVSVVAVSVAVVMDELAFRGHVGGARRSAITRYVHDQKGP
jgi:hypothetical protein